MKVFVVLKTNKAVIHRFIDLMPDDGTMKLEIKKNASKRTDAQNKLYWFWLGIIGDDTGYRPDEIHKLMKMQFLEPITYRIMDKDVIDYPSTTKLTVREFTEYLNMIELWASDLGMVMPHPEDIYYTAMGYMK